MGKRHKSLKGYFLLDGGNLMGSFFHRTVVLICHHDENGAFGLVLNRESGHAVGEALVADLAEPIRELPLLVGGPVQPQAMSFLHSDIFLPDANVMFNLRLGHSVEELVEISQSWSPTSRLKLFAGYAGWAPGQLEGELKRKAWLVHPASLELIFDTPPAQLWQRILRSKGPLYRLLAESPEDLSWN